MKFFVLHQVHTQFFFTYSRHHTAHEDDCSVDIFSTALHFMKTKQGCHAYFVSTWPFMLKQIERK